MFTKIRSTLEFVTYIGAATMAAQGMYDLARDHIDNIQDRRQK